MHEASHASAAAALCLAELETSPNALDVRIWTIRKGTGQERHLESGDQHCLGTSIDHGLADGVCAVDRICRHTYWDKAAHLTVVAAELESAHLRQRPR